MKKRDRLISKVTEALSRLPLAQLKRSSQSSLLEDRDPPWRPFNDE